jgi:predicted solute-binding protein
VRIRVGHSADPDDAFMFWAIEAGRVETRGLELEQVVSDIETLNRWAVEGRLEVTAISMGAYCERRRPLRPAAARWRLDGVRLRPVVVTREPLPLGAPASRDRDPWTAHDRLPRAALALGENLACASFRSTRSSTR